MKVTYSLKGCSISDKTARTLREAREAVKGIVFELARRRKGILSALVHGLAAQFVETDVHIDRKEGKTEVTFDFYALSDSMSSDIIHVVRAFKERGMTHT